MSSFYTTASLAARIQEKTGIDAETSKKFANTFFAIVKRELKTSDSFAVHNFGTFRKVWIETGTGRNPRTGEEITIPAHYRIRFTPSGPVAALINRNFAHLKAKPVKEINDRKTVENNSISEEPVFNDIPEQVTLREVIQERGSDSIPKPVSGKKKQHHFLSKIIGIIILAAVLCFLLIKIFTSIPPKKDKTEISPTAPGNTTEQNTKINSGSALTTESPAKPVPEVNESTDKNSNYENYYVPAGDCFYKIAGDKLHNIHLWPYLYAANSKTHPDPDLISTGENLLIPEAPDMKTHQYEIEQSVLIAYKAYCSLIDKNPTGIRAKIRKYNAVGTIVSGEILYPGFIEKYKNQISPEDIKSAEIRKAAISRQKN